jgi:RHS repeat-associated protein
MRSKLLVLSIWFLAFVAQLQQVSAQQFKFDPRHFSTKKTIGAIIAHGFPDTISVQTDLWSLSNWGSSYKIKSVHDIAKFYVNHDTDIVSTPYRYKALIHAFGWSNSTNPSPTVNFTDTLAITYNGASLVLFQDRFVKKFSGCIKYKLVITEIIDDLDPMNPVLFSTQGTSYTPAGVNCGFEAEIWQQRYDKAAYGGSYPSISSNITKVYNGDKGVLKVNFWDTTATSPKPAMYELEWTYVDNYSYNVTTGSSSTLNPSALRYDFKNNATRIVTDKPFYEIPIVYEKGYVVFRARIVRPDSITYAKPIYSGWTVTANSGVLSSLTANTSYYNVASSQDNDSLNWQYTMSFAEDGKYKQILSYFDGSLKNRQTITRFNSQPQNLIATESIYDYKGRPAINILPTPIDSVKFEYVNNVSVNSLTGKPYKAADFDTLQPTGLCPGENSVAPLDQTSWAYKYYSPLNPSQPGFQKFVPDAQGYPLVHTIIAPENDKKVLKQGGAGGILQMASGHITKYAYVQPEQSEINRLFGTEIGRTEYYKKTVITDPNTQSSYAITDNEGRTVASGMIGLGPDSVTHPIIPMELPGVSVIKDNLLDGITQIPVNNVWSLDKSFYVEAPGYHTVEYDVTIPPYGICGYTKFLTIGASYEYNVYDDCGGLKMHQAQILGTTGVHNTPVTNTLFGSPQTAYLDKMPHFLTKKMSFSLDSVYAAVDKFMEDPGGCLRDEPYFIREAVKKRNFPCPFDTTDPCGAARRRMMDELYPDAKYGGYRHANNDSTVSDIDSAYMRTNFAYVVLPQTGNSIFDFMILPYASLNVMMSGPQPFRNFRYRYCQDIVFPDTVWKQGRAYTDIRHINVDTLIYIFNDQIAEALLPLHPEYCKRCDSSEEHYEELLKSIPDFRTAQELGYFSLNDIVSHDPLYINYPMLYDSLVYARMTDKRMDSLCIALAFCGGVDSGQSAICFEKVFNNQVTSGTYNITTAPALIQQNYFEKIIPLYIGNRNIQKKKLQDLDTNRHCAPCDSFRIVYRPESVYGPQVYSSDSTSLSLLFDGLNNGVSMPQWMFGAFVGGGNSVNYLDSVMALMDTINLTFCDTQVTQIAQRLINCSTSPTVIQHIRDSLYNYYCVGDGKGQPFTPEGIRKALIQNSVSLNDLCNPYLVNYQPLPTGNMDAGMLSCRNSTFYDDAKSFFNSTPMLDAINTFTQRKRSLSTSNLFESQIISKLGLVAPRTVYFDVAYNSGRKMYNILITDSTNNTHKMNIWFKKTHPSGICGTRLDSLDYWRFRDILCLRDGAGTMYPSMINQYSFLADVLVADGGDTAICRTLAWNDSIPMFDTAIVENSGCIACPEIRAVYNDFKDTLGVYGICCTDHPNYDAMVRNYVNYTMDKQFLEDDIHAFIASCAVADSTKFQNTHGHFYIASITGANFESLINYLNTTYNTSIDFFKYTTSGSQSVSTPYNVFVSLGNIPYTKLLEAKNYIKGLYPAAKYMNSLNANRFAEIYVPSQIVNTWLPTMNYGITSGDLPQVDSATVNVSFGHEASASWLSYKKYDIHLLPGIPFYKLVDYTDSLKRTLYANTYGIQYFTNFDSKINNDYRLPEKKAFLNYNYALQDSIHYMLLRRLAEDSLTQNIGSYSTKNVTYSNPYITNDKSDLFISDVNQTSNTGYQLGYGILQAVFSANSNKLFFTADSTNISTSCCGLGGSDNLNVFRCGDNKTFLYRFFKANPDNKMYNLYIKIPAFVSHPEDWRYDAFELGNGDGELYRFNVKMHHVSNVNFKVDFYGYSDFPIGEGLNLEKSLLCHGMYDTWELPDTMNCEREMINASITEGKQQYLIYRDSARTRIANDYLTFLQNNIYEHLYLTTRDQKYQFTLYYYDRAGNLERTIPPTGVNRLPATISLMTDVNNHRQANTILAGTLPTHYNSSFYNYNSINKVTKQITPDGGEVVYFYDAVGRVVFSQNANQQEFGYVSYNLYDRLGRVIEVGEEMAACPPACGGCIPALLPQVYNSANYSLQALHDFILARNRRDVVSTLYDEEYKNMGAVDGMTKQQNLRKRVSTVKYFDALTANKRGDTAGHYDHATYYSYDITGNVKILMHEYPQMPLAMHRFKRVDYDYDMLSGKVNMVSYNRSGADQMYQRYNYDEDNRITKVESSSDGLYWDDDADYKYYQHGPLARMELGDLRVQGVDYAYTIQGWLKATNTDVRDSLYDMGKDGQNTSIFPTDVYTNALEYFPSDYEPIGTTPVMHIAPYAKGLFNGNISRQTVGIKGFGDLNREFKYDPLNRIKNAKYYDVDHVNSNTLVSTLEYRNKYDYDADGNILSLLRMGGKIGSNVYLMDSFINTYVPYIKPHQLIENFDYADDHYSGDIKKKLPQVMTIPHFEYDAIGRLRWDRRSANAEVISWTLYNKLKSITTEVSDTGSKLDFTYDGMGNRMTKRFNYVDVNGAHCDYDYYVRDASGNTLAVLNYKELYNEQYVKITDIVSATVDGMGLTPGQIGGVFSGNPIFTGSVVGQVSLNGGLTGTLLGGVSGIDIMNVDITTLPAQADPCFSFSSQMMVSNMPYVMARSMMKQAPADLMFHAMARGVDSTLGLWTAKWMPGFDSLCHTLGIDTNNVSVARTMLDSYYVQEPEILKSVATGILTAAGLDSANTAMRDSFALAIVTDPLLFAASAIDADWNNYVTQALQRHISDSMEVADRDTVIHFYANYPNATIAKDNLIAANDTIKLLHAVYKIDPQAFIDAYVAAMPDSLAEAIASIPGMSAARLIAYVDDIYTQVGVAEVLQTVLAGQTLNVAEHDIYGSSRVATQHYWNTGWNWKTGTTAYTDPATAFINIRQPWFSLDIHDLMKKDTLVPLYTKFDYDKWSAVRVLGNKSYELTDHLGDVQTTINDKLVPIVNGSNLLAWKADVVTTTDYYPFGMPMPGRRSDPLLEEPVQIGNVGGVMVSMRMADTSSGLPDTYAPQQHVASVGDWSIWPSNNSSSGHLNWGGTGNGLQVYSHTAAAAQPAGKLGMQLYMPTDIGREYTVWFITDNNNAGSLDAYALGYNDTTGRLTTLGSATVSRSGNYSITFTAVNDSSFLVLAASALDSDESFTINFASMLRMTNILVNTPTAPLAFRNKYRYGFNGQEKVDEISGPGNHYEFKFREYDPRLARFWSVDPLTAKFPALSPYQNSGNNPIATVDIDGLEPATINPGTQILVLVLQGFAGNPPNGATQAQNAGGEGLDPYGLGKIQQAASGSTTIQVVTYASSTSDNTKGDVTKTIKDFSSKNAHGKVVLVGHSQGADNIVELAKENKNLKLNLVITLDIKDADNNGIFSVDDDNIPSNVQYAINYYQTGEMVGGEKIEIDNKKKTQGANILSPGSNHRSIDNDMVNYVIQDIQNYINGKNPIAEAQKRKLPTNDPKKSGSDNVLSK